MEKKFDDYRNNSMTNDPANYKWGVFYFNRNDHRIAVNKYQKERGWTLNFANIYTYLLILGIIAVLLAFNWLA